jgi:YesN/AraC family two-component response regulator
MNCDHFVTLRKSFHIIPFINYYYLYDQIKSSFMNSYKFIPLFCIFAILFAAPMHAQQDNQQQKDSLRRLIATTKGEEKLTHYKNLSVLYFAEVADDRKMDTLVAVLNEMSREAEKQGNITLQGGALGTIINAYLNKGAYDEVFRLAPGYMDYLAKQEAWDFYYRIYKALFKAHLQSGDMPEALRTAEQMYADANARGNKFAMALALYSLADVYAKQSRSEEQETYMRKSIELLKGEDKWLNNLTDAYFSLCQSLIFQNRTDEALVAAGEYESVIHRYEEHQKAPQMASWVSLYQTYITLYLKKEDFDNAELYCNKLEELDKRIYIQYVLFRARARIFNARGQYDRALETADKAMAIASTATEKNDVRGIKMQILANAGRSLELYALAKEAAMVHDSIRSLDFNRQLDELRTQYELDEAEQQIRLRERTIIAVSGVVLLLAVALGIIGYLYRKRQIAYRELVRKNLQWADADIPQEVGTPDEIRDETPATEPVETDKKPSTMDTALMTEIRRRMITDKIYTNPELTMDYLARELGVSIVYVSAAVNRCEQKNFNAYINEFRVKEAIHLLSQQASAGQSVDEIADTAGFNDRKSFYRVFKKTTGLSPTDFRKNMRK